jgi:hypothetical protein
MAGVAFANEYKLKKPITINIYEKETHQYYSQDIKGGLIVDPAKYTYSTSASSASAEVVMFDYMKSKMTGDMKNIFRRTTNKQKNYLRKILLKQYKSEKEASKSLKKKYANKYVRLDRRIDFGRKKESGILFCYKILKNNLKTIDESGIVSVSLNSGKYKIDYLNNSEVYKFIKNNGGC